MNKRPLQIAMCALGVVPVVTGVITMLGLGDPIYSSAGLPANALLDSNLRFFGGLWLALGLAVYWLAGRPGHASLIHLWGDSTTAVPASPLKA